MDKKKNDSSLTDEFIDKNDFDYKPPKSSSGEEDNSFIIDNEDEYHYYDEMDKRCRRKCNHCCDLLQSTLGDNEKLEMIIHDIKKEYTFLSTLYMKSLEDKNDKKYIPLKFNK